MPGLLFKSVYWSGILASFADKRHQVANTINKMYHEPVCTFVNYKRVPQKEHRLVPIVQQSDLMLMPL